jgi:outer membrane protein TolC
LVLLLASLAPSISVAQTGAAQSQQTRLTLARALAIADARYPQIRVAIEQQSAAHGEIAVARTAYLPRVDML